MLYVLGSDLRVCPKNSGKQCCSQRMEDRFTVWSKSDFSEAVPSKIEKLKDVFDEQAKIFDGKRFPLKSELRESGFNPGNEKRLKGHSLRICLAE